MKSDLCLVGLLLALLMALPACGAGAWEAHAAALSASRTALNLAASGIEEGCSQAIETAEATEEAHADVMQRCRRARDGHALVVDAWTGWLELALAARDGGFRADDALVLARNLVRLYADVVRFAADFGADLPDLPPLVLSLLGPPEGGGP